MATFVNASAQVSTRPTYLAAEGVNSGGATDTVSISHTIAADTNMIVVFVGARDGSDPTISSITYNSVAMTELVTAANGGTYMKTFCYYMLNPPSGAQTLQVTFNQAQNAIRMEVIDVKNASAVQPQASGNSTTSNGTTCTPSVTTTGPAVILWGMYGGGSVVPSSSGDGTQIDIGSTGGGTPAQYLHAYLEVSTAVTKTHTLTIDGPREMSGIGVAIN